MELIVTYIISVASSALVARLLIGKYMSEIEQLVDNCLKEHNDFTIQVVEKSMRETNQRYSQFWEHHLKRLEIEDNICNKSKRQDNDGDKNE